MAWGRAPAPGGQPNGATTNGAGGKAHETAQLVNVVATGSVDQTIKVRSPSLPLSALAVARPDRLARPSSQIWIP